MRAAGPLPALHVGHQPYGLLPSQSLNLLGNHRRWQIVSSKRYKRYAPAGVGRSVGRHGCSQDYIRADLVEVLRMQPSSVGYQARLAFDNQFFVPAGVVQGGTLDPNLKAHSDLLRSRLRVCWPQSNCWAMPVCSMLYPPKRLRGCGLAWCNRLAQRPERR